MARVTVEDCLEHVDNRFDLVLLAAKRARQLTNGVDPLVPWENDKATVVAKVRAAPYAGKFVYLFGPDAFDDVEAAYDNIAAAIAAFERSPEMNPFTSKFDYWQRGQATLTAQELLGLQVFTNKGKCSTCHTLVENPTDPDVERSLFTNFRYFNIGVPKNPNNPFYNQPPQFNPDGAAFIDYGLGAAIGVTTENGKFKVPTLRNVELTAPYMHNGVFATLEEVVDFYNADDNNPPPPPEVDNDISADVGFLGLTPEEKAALVAFMKTLTDGYVP